MEADQESEKVLWEGEEEARMAGDKEGNGGKGNTERPDPGTEEPALGRRFKRISMELRLWSSRSSPASASL